jgi:hypothetical protein
MTDQHPPLHDDPTLPLPRHAWWQLTRTLETLLPPPLNDTPEALLARANAAFARISDMAPANSDEADLAATCVVLRAQAEQAAREIQCVGDSDPKEHGRLTRLYLALVRTGLSVYRQLQRTKALRQARDKDAASASADAWTRYVAAREMQQAQAHRLTPAEMPVLAPPPLEERTKAAATPLLQPAAAAPPAAHRPPADDPKASPACQPRPAPAFLPLAHPPEAARPLRPEPCIVPWRGGAAQEEQAADEPPRDLEAELARYAALYPRRVQQIREHGGLPPDCAFGPPDEALLAALIGTAHPAVLAALGEAEAA